MDRDGEHVVALEEDALRAVAVMDVDIEHGDALRACCADAGRRWRCCSGSRSRPPCRHRRDGPAAGRAHRPRARPPSTRSAAVAADLARGEGCVPGARPDRAGEVDLMPAGAADQRLRVGRGIARRMNVGHDLGRGVGQLRPVARGGLQEVDDIRACGRSAPAASRYAWARRPRGRRPWRRPAGASARSGCSALRCLTPRTKKVCGSCWACLSE